MLCCLKSQKSYDTDQADEKNKTNVPLQVRSPFYVKKLLSVEKERKLIFDSRAFLFISKEKTAQRKASLTLEAAFVLSLLVFACVSLMLPAKIMMTERKMQAALESAGEELSQYAYLLDALEQGKFSSVVGASKTAKTFCKNASSIAAPLYAQKKVMEACDTEQVSKIHMLESSVRKDGETLDLVMKYEISMPFPVLGLSSLKRTARCRRRCWIGREGRYGEGEEEGGTDETIVYVGKNSTRYHPDRNCHYLSNRLTVVSWESISEKRNQNGGKYYPCSSCAKGAGKGSVVYIMPSGNRYHSKQDCKAIMAYVRAVRLKEVKHLGACSYCGGSSS